MDQCLRTVRSCKQFCVHQKIHARLSLSQGRFSYYFHDLFFRIDTLNHPCKQFCDENLTRQINIQQTKRQIKKELLLLPSRFTIWLLTSNCVSRSISLATERFFSRHTIEASWVYFDITTFYLVHQICVYRCKLTR